MKPDPFFTQHIFLLFFSVWSVPWHCYVVHEWNVIDVLVVLSPLDLFGLGYSFREVPINAIIIRKKIGFLRHSSPKNLSLNPELFRRNFRSKNGLRPPSQR